MPFPDGYNKTIYVDEDVTPTGTPDLNAANLNNNENFTKTLSTQMSATVTDLEALETTVAGISTGYVDQMYINGLKLSWVSNTQISVGTGACYTLASGGIGEATASTTLTPTLAANTRYYVYAANVSGVLSYQVSSTAPVVYRGTAQQKTGDSSYRMIGSFRTDASANIMKTTAVVTGSGGWVHYAEAMRATANLVLNDGRSLTPASVSLATWVPVGCRLVEIFLKAVVTVDNAFYFAHSEMDFTLAANISNSYKSFYADTVQTGGAGDSVLMPLDSSQAFQYLATSSTVGSGVDIALQGYYFER